MTIAIRAAMIKPVPKRRGTAKPTAPPQPVDPPNEETWRCADGRVLKVSEMHEDHCRNALRMVLRQKRQGKLLTRKEAFLFVAKALEEATQETLGTILQRQVGPLAGLGMEDQP